MAVGDIDRFGPGADIEFAKDVGDMGAGGVTADEKRCGDLRVGLAVGDEP